MRYEIIGEPMPVVICHLENGESMTSEKGSMVWMSENMEMQTEGGGIGKVFGRMISGESLFQNVYTARKGQGMIAFGSSFPGSIRAITLHRGQSVICQKSAFLAAEPGVQLSVFFQKKISSGLFGGEGFVMQKLSGEGVAFVELDGATVEYDLGVGEKLIVDTGNLALIDDTCSIDIQSVKGVKNALFGGEGLFNTVVTGPGHVVLQTMPLSSFVSTIAPLLPQNNSGK